MTLSVKKLPILHISIIDDAGNKQYAVRPEDELNGCILDDRYSWQWVEDEDEENRELLKESLKILSKGEPTIPTTIEDLRERIKDNDLISAKALKERIESKCMNFMIGPLILEDSREQKILNTYYDVLTMIGGLQKGNEDG